MIGLNSLSSSMAEHSGTEYYSFIIYESIILKNAVIIKVAISCPYKKKKKKEMFVYGW